MPCWLDHDRGMPVVRLQASWGWADIACQGGQLWQVHLGGRERLYTSPSTPWQLGQPLRGGVPLCWPWLGRHPQHPEWGMHGPLRVQTFHLLKHEEQDQRLCASLGCELDTQLPGIVSPCSARLHCALTRNSVSLLLSIHNRGDQPQPSAGAMHTYLACEATALQVHGLDGCPWHGPDDSDEHGTIQNIITHCSGSTRTIYDVQQRPYPIIASDGEQHARLQRWGSRSVVLWNPGSAHGIADIPADDWQQFVCVETANSGNDARSIPPGGVGTMASRWQWGDSVCVLSTTRLP